MSNYRNVLLDEAARGNEHRDEAWEQRARVDQPRRKRGEGRALTLKVKGYREFSGRASTSNHDAPPMTLSIFSES